MLRPVFFALLAMLVVTTPVAAQTEPALAPAAADADEAVALPPYPPKAIIGVGKQTTYKMGEEDTLLDVARHFRLGYVEARAANPGIDPWAPIPGQEVIIPGFKLLPRAPQDGIVVNLGEMRLYYFPAPGKEPLSYPIGVGREGLQTPTGKTTVVRKAEAPSWFPTERMRAENPSLPRAVGPGPANPLGTHALYLGWPTFLIHGSNKPWAIGRRVSSGCIRMYPEDIKDIFPRVPTGTRVTIVDQPILVGRIDDKIWLEMNPSKTQGYEIEIDGVHTVKPLSSALRKVIIDAAGVPEGEIDWATVETAAKQRTGYPVVIWGAAPPKPAMTARPAVSSDYVFNR